MTEYMFNVYKDIVYTIYNIYEANSNSMANYMNVISKETCMHGF